MIDASQYPANDAMVTQRTVENLPFARIAPPAREVRIRKVTPQVWCEVVRRAGMVQPS